MIAHNRKFMAEYSRGMDMLAFSGDAFLHLVQKLGYPIFDESIPTAQVQLNMDEQRVEFVVNPNYLEGLSDSEVAAVIAHETYHVLLDHLSEIGDRTEYPNSSILIDAQECIINDSLPSSVGFETPNGTFKGPERHDQDFSNFTSREAYDFIAAKTPEQEEDPQEKGDDNSNGGQGDDSKSEGKSGSGDEQKNDNESKSSDSESDQEKDGANGADPQENSSEGGQNSDGSGGDQDTDTSDSGHGCGGVKVIGEGSDDPQKVSDALGKALAKALSGVDQNDLPQDVQEALEDLRDGGTPLPSQSYSLGQPKDGFNKIDPYAHLNVNWLALLQAINPKMKQAGKPKFKDSWHAPRRRMIHSYPSVILPTRVRLDDPNKKKGDSIPSFVIALDMSGSIPEHLLTVLAGFAQSIPEKLIKAFPITWSDGHKVFDPKKPREMVPRGGTTISTVMSYVKKVEKETGTKPYVLVITDGHYYIPNNWDKAEIMDRWFWMGIQSQDVQSIMASTGAWTTMDRVFDLNKFI